MTVFFKLNTVPIYQKLIKLPKVLPIMLGILLPMAI